MYQVNWKNGSELLSVNAYSTEEKETFVKALSLAGFTAIVNCLSETAQAAKKRFVVKIVFTPGGRPYTYLCNSKIPVGDLVVVWTQDGRQVVRVIDSGEMTDSELEKICPIGRFRYIEGRVVAA
jgi:hypothetical protein